MTPEKNLQTILLTKILSKKIIPRISLELHNKSGIFLNLSCIQILVSRNAEILKKKFAQKGKIKPAKLDTIQSSRITTELY